MNYAIVLAAGKGSRMKTNIPKCGVSLLDKPMIGYIIEALKNTSVDEIICVVGYKKEFFYNYLKTKVSYRIQEEQLGSGHAVMCCKDIDKSGYTVILNGDTPLIDFQLIQGLINEHLEKNNDVTLLTVEKDNPTSYGRIIRENQRIIKIVEELDLTLKQKEIKEVNSGILCINTKLLFEALEKIDNHNAKKEFYLTDIIDILNGYKIDSYRIAEEEKLMGINTIYELCKAEEILRKRIIDKHLKNGVQIQNISSTSIGYDVIIEEGAIIQGSTLLGNSVIHKNTQVMQSYIENSVIFEDSEVLYSVIRDSVVGKKCSVGPFAHIRSGSLISGNNRIGNYVEIKNSKIGKETKLSHLSYMGDCLCGDDVNFGCGSITVNYDGKNKNKTTIGDHVFIGCNTNLIAPIHIASQSFIAAGSTITDNIDSDDFAIARSRQTIKKGYANKYMNLKDNEDI